MIKEFTFWGEFVQKVRRSPQDALVLKFMENLSLTSDCNCYAEISNENKPFQKNAK